MPDKTVKIVAVCLGLKLKRESRFFPKNRPMRLPTKAMIPDKTTKINMIRKAKL